VVGHLPLDIHLLIAEYISGHDIYSFQNVSRRWRKVWTQEKVVRYLATKWLPGYLESIDFQERTRKVTQDQEQLFLEAARRLHFRSLGKFRSALEVEGWIYSPHGSAFERYYFLDPELPALRYSSYSPLTYEDLEELTLEDSTDLRYSSGRLAWQLDSLPFPESSSVMVDDFRTRLRKTYRVPNNIMLGRRVQLQEIGDELVVASIDRVT
jgi:hypothetical protein